ncbi:hypothetical protein Xvie_03992 [Xenorhabdus vietnamensis]|uniref:Uncharacterized protein n=1 Tax=Xenorhabdus vietnamensis TaxID=351656 RepID=A0A1Y2S8T5_9GAMM|nr:hypothetical protein Xvie_03992 [Xenorhabdus vietnamensis]
MSRAVYLPKYANNLPMVQPSRGTSPTDVEETESDPENAGLSVPMENTFNVQFLLNMCGDTDLSGAGCGSSARPVLRRGLSG